MTFEGLRGGMLLSGRTHNEFQEWEAQIVAFARLQTY